MVVTLGQQYNVGDKPNVILHTYINHHVGTPSRTETKDTMSAWIQLNFVTLGLGSDGCQHYTTGISTRLPQYSIIYMKANEIRYMMTGVPTVSWSGQNESTTIHCVHGICRIFNTQRLESRERLEDEGTKRTTTQVLNTIQKVRNTGIHLRK